MPGIMIKTANGYQPMVGTELSPLTVDNLPEQFRCPVIATEGNYKTDMEDPDYLWFMNRESRRNAFNADQVQILSAHAA